MIEKPTEENFGPRQREAVATLATPVGPAYVARPSTPFGGRLARHKSAEKRARQDVKRRERNRTVRTRTRGIVKALRAEIETGGAAVEGKLRSAEGALRRAATKGVIPKRRASRQVSRLAKAANRAKAK